MSLTSFVKMPEVMSKMKPFRPNSKRKITASLKAPPKSKRYKTVGTAFDYLLRFELQRLAPHAACQPWIAEHVSGMLWNCEGQVVTFMHLYRDDQGQIALASSPDQLTDDGTLAKEIADHVADIVGNAKKHVAAFLKLKSPKSEVLSELAAHAIRLAKLDAMYRAHYFDPNFASVSSEDVEDLVAMLGIATFDSLSHERIMLLNPNFGDSSGLLGGADCDLISGDLLIDFKTTKSGEMEPRDLDQLLGYYLLARNRRQADSKFPEIRRVGLYFCRYGFLWTFDVSDWTSRPGFGEFEQWFFKRAGEVFSRQPILRSVDRPLGL